MDGKQSGVLRLITRYPSVAALIFGLILTVLMLFSMDCAVRVCFHFRARPVPLITTVFPADAYRPSRLGYQFPAGEKVVQTKEKGGQVIMSSTATINEQGYRATPVSPGERDKFVMLFVDSFVFGEGLPDNETLPCFLGSAAPHCRPYNFGLPGHGPQQMYMRLSENMVKPLVKESSGTGIYVFIDDHPLRAVGSLRIFNVWGSEHPCYGLRDGQPVYEGTFEEARPIRNYLYRQLWKSHAVRNLEVEWPPITGSTLEFTATLVRASRDAFEKSFPGSRFAVLTYPGSSQHCGHRFASLLERDHIPFVCDDHFFTPEDMASALPDGHPSARMHKKVAERLAEVLKLD